MEGVFFFEPKDIVRLEGEGNYTRFFFSNHKPILISHTIKKYEDILFDFDFLRVHKSHLVNKKFVKQLDNEGFLLLTDGSHIGVSRRKKEDTYEGADEEIMCEFANVQMCKCANVQMCECAN